MSRLPDQYPPGVPLARRQYLLRAAARRIPSEHDRHGDSEPRFAESVPRHGAESRARAAVYAGAARREVQGEGDGIRRALCGLYARLPCPPADQTRRKARFSSCSCLPDDVRVFSGKAPRQDGTVGIVGVSCALTNVAWRLENPALRHPGPGRPAGLLRVRLALGQHRFSDRPQHPPAFGGGGQAG